MTAVQLSSSGPWVRLLKITFTHDYFEDSVFPGFRARPLPATESCGDQPLAGSGGFGLELQPDAQGFSLWARAGGKFHRLQGPALLDAVRDHAFGWELKPDGFNFTAVTELPLNGSVNPGNGGASSSVFALVNAAGPAMKPAAPSPAIGRLVVRTKADGTPLVDGGLRLILAGRSLCEVKAALPARGPAALSAHFGARSLYWRYWIFTSKESRPFAKAPIQTFPGPLGDKPDATSEFETPQPPLPDGFTHLSGQLTTFQSTAPIPLKHREKPRYALVFDKNDRLPLPTPALDFGFASPPSPARALCADIFVHFS